MSFSKFKISDIPKKRGSYNINIKAKLNSHLLLKDSDQILLGNLLDDSAPGVVEKKWDLSNQEHITDRDQFLRENGLDIDSNDIHCKCYREKEIVPNSQISAAHYPYAECLAFVTLYLHDNEICAIAGYLQHSEKCLISKPQHDPPYKLLPYIKKSVENLLGLNVRTSDILAQNARTVKNVFRNRTLIGDFRTLLTAIDISNIKKQIL
ncbi:hypothetical protein F8M41_025591 [Gigaspora margarita]|uniref:Uncharacterized protein n=1 Tax=Gigaspora margarita TaxID=4874 RepID=A0A8H4ABK8_GIGMA|nr:hypothetical protein F8M41_025591 [Gigaspora margarita]